MDTETSRGAGSRRHRWRPSPLRLFLLVLILVLIAGGTSLFMLLNKGPETDALSRFKADLAAGSFKEARAVYYEELFGDVALQAEAETEALNALAGVREAYSEGRISYEAAERRIRALEQSGIFLPMQALDDAYDSLRLVNQSNLQLARGYAAHDAGDYTGAIQAFRSVEAGTPFSRQAAAALKRSESAYRDGIIEAAEQLAATGEQLGAVQLLEAALRMIPQDETLVDAYSTAINTSDSRYRRRILLAARDAEDRGELEEALEILRSAVRYLESLTRLSAAEMEDHVLRQANLLTDIRTINVESARLQANYENSIQSDLTGLLEAGNRLAAMELLAEAQRVLPDSERLRQQEAGMAGSLDIPLMDYMLPSAAMSSIDHRLLILSDWVREDAESRAVQLWPVPAGQGPALGIGRLLPGVNLLGGELVWAIPPEFQDEDSEFWTGLQALVTIRSGEVSEVLILTAEENTLSFDVPVDRTAGISMSVDFRMNGETLTEDERIRLDEQDAPLLLTDAVFRNDGSFDISEDYLRFREEEAAFGKLDAAADWRELSALTLLPAADGEGSDPFRAGRTTDRDSERYTDAWLISQDSRQPMIWQGSLPLYRIRGTLAWADPESLPVAAASGLRTGESVLAANEEAGAPDLLLEFYSEDRLLGRYGLESAMSRTSIDLYTEQPFTSLTVLLRPVNESSEGETASADSLWTVVLDLEVAP